VTTKTFTHHLRKGLGSAIIELQTNPNREIYREIVLRACLFNIAYDPQVEGTKSWYLYTAIKTFEDTDYFLDAITEKFQKRLWSRLWWQVRDLVFLFARDGNRKALDAIDEKYNYLKNKLPKMKKFDWKYFEHQQIEDLMVFKIEMGGFDAFKQCADDINEMITINPNCVSYDEFLMHAEEKFGKEMVWEYIGESVIKKPPYTHEPPPIKIFKYGEFKKSAYEKDDSPYFSKSRGRAINFSRQATPEEFEKVANDIISEPDENVKAKLLLTFRRVDFPLDIGLILPYALSGNDFLRESAAKVLSHFKDERVHDLATQLFERDVVNAVKLLKNNWETSDAAYIRKYVLRSKKIPHSVQTTLSEIADCGDILMHLYENGDCTYCRHKTIQAMIKNNIILDEWKYDSYEQTRRLII